MHVYAFTLILYIMYLILLNLELYIQKNVSKICFHKFRLGRSRQPSGKCALCVCVCVRTCACVRTK